LCRFSLPQFPSAQLAVPHVKSVKGLANQIFCCLGLVAVSVELVSLGSADQIPVANALVDFALMKELAPLAVELHVVPVVFASMEHVKLTRPRMHTAAQNVKRASTADARLTISLTGKLAPLEFAEMASARALACWPLPELRAVNDATPA
jgi:hypothetical protein